MKKDSSKRVALGEHLLRAKQEVVVVVVWVASVGELASYAIKYRMQFLIDDSTYTSTMEFK